LCIGTNQNGFLLRNHKQILHNTSEVKAKQIK
jgi:hypothetical protein